MPNHASSTALEIILYKHVSYLAMFELRLDQMEMTHQLSKAPLLKCFQTVMLAHQSIYSSPYVLYIYIYILFASHVTHRMLYI